MSSIIITFLSHNYFLLAWIINTFYRQRKEMNEYLGSSEETLSQSHYYRILALGYFDIFLTLPIGVTELVVGLNKTNSLRFYEGWSVIHTNWDPALVPKSVWSAEKWGAFSVHWDQWINFVFAVAFFALFGLTPEAKKGYQSFFRPLSRRFGVKRSEEALPIAVFASRRGLNATFTSNASSSSR